MSDRLLHRVKPGTVYFMAPADGGPIRIGVTEIGAPSRRSCVGAMMPFELKVLAEIPGNRVREAMLHHRFARDRLRGDWFRPSVQLWKLIGEAQAYGDIANLPPEPEYRTPAVAALDGLSAIGINRQRIATLLGISTASLGQYINASYTPASLAALHLSLTSGWLTEDHYVPEGCA